MYFREKLRVAVSTLALAESGYVVLPRPRVGFKGLKAMVGKIRLGVQKFTKNKPGKAY